jgi:two-component system, NarL family, nitrate/nitrite response regulator NarL
MTAPLRRYRVVLVESVPSLLDALRWALEETAELLVVGETDSGVEAVALAERLRPDLMIVDTGLHPLDGFAVTRILKELPSPPAVLLLAAHCDPPAVRHAGEVGSDGIAAKDSGWEALLAAIRQALGHAPAPSGHHFPSS